MGGGHHSEVTQIMETAPAEMGTEGAIENRQVFGPQRSGVKPIRFRLASNNSGIIGARHRIFNGIEQIDVLDHPRDFFFCVS